MSALVAVLHRDGAPVARETAERAKSVSMGPQAAPYPSALRALAAQTARGPDGQRVWCEGPVAIGHALLATTPEDERTAQPFVTPDGALVAALDGRIDNRAEIAAATGLVTRDAPDVEVAAAAYARWGDAFAARLHGDFAIVLWDARRREIVCARDPLAARPLYVRDDGRRLVCASEPLALFAATGEAPSPNFDAMALLLVEQYVERGDTLLRGVEAILPGSVLCVGAAISGRSPLVARRVVPPSWPSAIVPRKLASIEEYAAELRAALREAVAVRMRARGRLAAHVSGGLDSSSVAALATEVARDRGEEPPLLVRCVFPGLPCDESKESDAVAAHLGLPIESVEMPGDPGDFVFDPEGRPTPIEGEGEAPYENPISRMLARMTIRARALGARVTLTGAGSDQLLQPTGYELSGALRRGDVRVALDLAGLPGSPLSIGAYATLFREGLYRMLPIPWREAIRRARKRDDGLPPWLTAEARRAIHRHAGGSRPRLSREDFRTEAVRQLVTRIAHNADYSYSLVLADRIAGARGGDLRHPFFDRRVIDLVLSFPDEIRAAGPPNKALLRRAMGASLPAIVRDRASAAEFSPLVQRALVEPHGAALAALLRRGRLAAEGLVDPAGAAAAIERARHDEGAVREVMMLAWLEAWLRALPGGAIRLAPSAAPP